MGDTLLEVNIRPVKAQQLTTTKAKVELNENGKVEVGVFHLFQYHGDLIFGAVLSLIFDSLRQRDIETGVGGNLSFHY